MLLPAKDTSHTGQILYASIDLKSGLYNKDKLNCILKDVKAILNEYKDSCDQIIIVFRDAKKYINWYTFIDNVDNSSQSIICCADYLSYIKDLYITYFSIKNSEYYYQCEILLEVYDIDEEFTNKQFTSADL